MALAPEDVPFEKLPDGTRYLTFEQIAKNPQIAEFARLNQQHFVNDWVAGLAKYRPPAGLE